MKKFAIEIFCTIVGIGSSSGIHYQDGVIFLVSDNASKLYKFDKQKDLISYANIYDAPITENIPKKEKADFESLAFADGTYHVFGSGSTDRRNVAFQLSEHPDSSRKLDMTVLYEAMQKTSGIDKQNFNIEGALKTDANWYFFQRGNGINAVNGIFKTDANLADINAITFTKVVIPNIANATSGFTDAVMVNGVCWFLAAAENSGSTYEDGSVAGSAIGTLDLQTGKILRFDVISTRNKFEGLTHFETKNGKISFLLCEDDDSGKLQTIVYKLTLQK